MSFATIDHTNRTRIKPQYRARDSQHKRVNRNFAGLPSDSEDEDDTSVSSTASLQDKTYLRHPKIPSHNNAKVKTVAPLPSDESDDDEDDEEISQNMPTKHSVSKIARKSACGQDLLYRNNRSAPSLPHQFEKHHAEFVQPQPHTKGGHRSISTEDIKRLTSHPATKHHSHPSHYQHHPSQKQMRMATMSGMDLLIQREQEKAEAKRQKPKIDPGKAKIEGLLGKLPEPGAHNINFQQVQQQFMMSASPTPSHSMHRNKRPGKTQASFYSLQPPPAFLPPVPSAPTNTGAPMFDYRNRPHYSMPASHPGTYFIINQQTMTRPGSTINQPINNDKKPQQQQKLHAPI